MRLSVFHFAWVLGALMLPAAAMSQDAMPQGHGPMPHAMPVSHHAAMGGAGPFHHHGAVHHHHGPYAPGYAGPVPAGHPNFGAVSYPKPHAPAVWPYIGPYYPNPQIPPGWKKVALEWDDGYWYLDFKTGKGRRHR